MQATTHLLLHQGYPIPDEGKAMLLTERYK